MSDAQGTGTVTGQPQMLDMTKHGSLLVPLKGFDKPVPLEQVAAGFMRHSDYTNKTQQLAKERGEIESQRKRFDEMSQWFKSLDTNPEETFRALQRAYNITPESNTVDGQFDDVDPRVASMQAELNSLKQQLAQSTESTQTMAAASQLATEFPDLQLEDVKAYLAANNMEPHRIMDAAKLMSYDRIAEERQMALEAETSRQAALNAVVDAKVGLPPISTGGAPTPSPDLLPSMEPELPSWDESFQLAQAELGQGLL